MNRSTSILTGLALVMAVGECISAVAIVVENYADSAPEFAVVFAALFFTGAWLLRKRRVVTGAALVGLLAVFEIVTFPSWQKHNTYDWVSDIVYLTVAALTLVFAIRALVGPRLRLRAVPAQRV